MAKKWETALKKQRELRKQGASVLYQRVALLAGCYASEEFRAWCESHGTSDLVFLDKELEDTAATFLTLFAVFERYPEEDTWTGRNIRELISEVIESQKRPSETKRRSWKERALAAEAECDRLRSELASMKESLGIVAGAKCG